LSTFPFLGDYNALCVTIAYCLAGTNLQILVLAAAPRTWVCLSSVVSKQVSGTRRAGFFE